MDAYKPNHKLEGLYQIALQETDEILDELCPALTRLKHIADKYQEREFLGSGALKEVYKCYDQKAQRWVAIAQPRPGLDKSYYDHFIHEAHLTASLKHPNIIKIHEVDVCPLGVPYFSMDLKGNTTLADVVKGGVPQAQGIEILLKICDAMAYAHQHEIIHLDLKPENIQCDLYGEVLVCDWGLGQTLDAHELGPLSLSQQQTLYGRIKGTPGFMAPEQATPANRKDQRTDLYSLGALLYYLLTSSAPYQGTSEEILEATAQGTFTPLSEHGHFSQSISAVVKKALSLSPDERYQSVEEFQSDLRKYLQGFTPKAERPHVLKEAYMFLSRHRAKAAIITIALLTITTLTSVYWQRSSDLSHHLNEREQIALSLRQEVDSLNHAITTLELRNSAINQALSSNDIDKVKRLYNLLRKEWRLRNHDFSERVNMAQAILLEINSIMPNEVDFNGSLCRFSSIQLGFKLANSLHLDPNDMKRMRYLSHAQLRPDFDFNSIQRPSQEQLIDFIYETKTLPIPDSRLIHEIVRYDHAVRKDLTGYRKVIHALLDCYPILQEAYRYDKETANFELTNADAAYNVQRRHSSYLLSYLSFNTVIIHDRSILHTKILRGTEIKNLVLRNTRELAANSRLPPVEIKGLETLTIPEYLANNQDVRAYIQSDREYDIIIAPLMPER